MCLNAINSELVVCDASDIINGQGSAAAKRQIQSSAEHGKLKDNMGLPSKLQMKVGAKYMLTYNVDTSDGLVNGATEKLQKIDLGTNEEVHKKPLRIRMEFDEQKIGSHLRVKNSTLMRKLKIPKTWTQLERIVLTIKTRKNSNLI